jgi:hypothetical protein
MRILLLCGALAVSAVIPSVAGAARSTPSSWTTQANKVCVVWLAKANKEFGHPVKPSQLYGFAVKAKTLESQELAVLQQIPGRNAAGTHALAAVGVDIAEVGSAITAYKAGNTDSFITILKKYLNDNRAKAAFTAAGAGKCG